MEHFGHTKSTTYVSAPIDQQGLPGLIPPKTEGRTPRNWKSPFPEKFCSEKILEWKPQMEDLTLKPNKNRPVCKKIDVELLGHNSQINSLDAFLVPSTYRCVRNPLHTRYTPGEWESWNNSTYSTAGSICDDAESIMKTCGEKGLENAKKASKADANTRNELFERITEIHLKKNEIHNEKKGLTDETDELSELKEQIDDILKELLNSLKISEHCLFERDKRQGIDLAHDSVEKALVCEVHTIKTCFDKFHDSADKILTQQGQNRSALHENEMDIIDKDRAKHIDETAVNTSIDDPAIKASGYKDMEMVDNCITDPRTWLHSTIATIERCRNERAPSKNLKATLESLIRDTLTQVLQAWNRTNKALADRINETLEAKTQLAKKLDIVNHQIYNMHGNMEDIRRAIDSHNAIYQKEQKMLDLRLRRPNVEACHDKAQENLLEEGSVLINVMQESENDLHRSGDSLQLLQRMKTALEEDIAIKNNTLFIDREKVRAMRKKFPLIAHCGIRVKIEPDLFNILE